MSTYPRNDPTPEVSDAQRSAWKARYATSDQAAGIETTEAFKPFSQRDEVFSRAFWDPTVKSKATETFFASYRIEASPRRGEGFTQKDFALRNASWIISDLISNRGNSDGLREGFIGYIRPDTPVASTRVDYANPAEASAEVKSVARLFGADLCGITDYDERWVYRSTVDARDFSEQPNELPGGLTSVIVLGHKMDAGLTQTYPSALAGAATGAAYSKEAAIVIQLAAYIRNLGYDAVASMNDTALVIPYAIKAGLGEFARNQLVITPEFGPRLRFSKIFTNMPLAHDVPRKLGVVDVCNQCSRCADACPVKALPFGPPSAEPVNRSSIQGVKKWTANAEACFGYWAKLASDCAICLRVCPFNRDFSKRANRWWLRLALSPLRGFALRLDDWSKRAERLKPSAWWRQRGR
jgi:epoxyqueuosine reductase